MFKIRSVFYLIREIKHCLAESFEDSLNIYGPKILESNPQLLITTNLSWSAVWILVRLEYLTVSLSLNGKAD